MRSIQDRSMRDVPCTPKFVNGKRHSQDSTLEKQEGQGDCVSRINNAQQ